MGLFSCFSPPDTVEASNRNVLEDPIGLPNKQAEAPAHAVAPTEIAEEEREDRREEMEEKYKEDEQVAVVDEVEQIAVISELEIEIEETEKVEVRPAQNGNRSDAQEQAQRSSQHEQPPAGQPRKLDESRHASSKGAESAPSVIPSSDTETPKFPSTQLSELLTCLASVNSKDFWGNLQKAVAMMSKTIGGYASVAALSSSKKLSKVTTAGHSGTSKPSSMIWMNEMPGVYDVVKNEKPYFLDILDPAGPIPIDFAQMHQEDGRTLFVCIPLCSGQLQGTLTLAGPSTSHILREPSAFLAGAVPMLAMLLLENSAVKMVNVMEKVMECNSINALAWVITSELPSWFGWCHPEDVEARLVLLSDDKPTCLVISRSPTLITEDDSMTSSEPPLTAMKEAMSQYLASSKSPVLKKRLGSGMLEGTKNSIGSPFDSVRSSPNVSKLNCSASNKAMMTGSGVKQGGKVGLQAVSMSLTNTLTHKCLAGGSKLLFVADVMAALKMYAEPWKDIFLDHALVTNPTWIVAAPIIHERTPLGAVVWLSTARVTTSLLAQVAKSTVPQLLQAISVRLQLLRLKNASYNFPSQTQVYQGLPSFTSQACSPERPGDAVDRTPSLVNHEPISNASLIAAGNKFGNVGTGSNCGPGSSKLGNMGPGSNTSVSSSFGLFSNTYDPDARPVRMTTSDAEGVSTQALMRMYQAAIHKHQLEEEMSSQSETNGANEAEQIEVLALAGQGAFGTVYVANWKGMYVAVKVMKQQTDGRKTMRTAWELAVTKSVSHRNVVTVLALLTDVAVKRVSRGIIQFVTKHGSSEPGTRRPSPSNSGSHAQAPTEVQPSCQVIIMEYCNLGPLHHCLADGRFIRRGSGELHNWPLIDASNCWLATKVDMSMVLQTLLEIATALLYLHGCGFIHCDLKPENILLKSSVSDSRGFVTKVTDFGLSDLYTCEGPLMGELGGTVTHLAPEVVLHKQVTKAADVYSFGIIMWEMYTWQRPYLEYLKSSTEKSVMEKAILTNVAHEQVRPIFPSTTPPDYERLAKTCWLAEPLSRPTFSEVMAELRYMQEMCNHATAPDSRSSRSFSGTGGSGPTTPSMRFFSHAGGSGEGGCGRGGAGFGGGAGGSGEGGSGRGCAGFGGGEGGSGRGEGGSGHGGAGFGGGAGGSGATSPSMRSVFGAGGGGTGGGSGGGGAGFGGGADGSGATSPGMRSAFGAGGGGTGGSGGGAAGGSGESGSGRGVAGFGGVASGSGATLPGIRSAFGAGGGGERGSGRGSAGFGGVTAIRTLSPDLVPPTYP